MQKLASLLVNSFFFSFIQSSDPVDNEAWKDKGVGHLSIKCKEGASKATKESKPTIVVRNDVCFLFRVHLVLMMFVNLKS